MFLQFVKLCFMTVKQYWNLSWPCVASTSDTYTRLQVTSKIDTCNTADLDRLKKDKCFCMSVLVDFERNYFWLWDVASKSISLNLLKIIRVDGLLFSPTDKHTLLIEARANNVDPVSLRVNFLLQLFLVSGAKLPSNKQPSVLKMNKADRIEIIWRLLPSISIFSFKHTGKRLLKYTSRRHPRAVTGCLRG